MVENFQERNFIICLRKKYIHIKQQHKTTCIKSGSVKTGCGSQESKDWLWVSVVRNKKIGKIQTGRKKGDEDGPGTGDDSKILKTNAHGAVRQCRCLVKTKESSGRLTWKSEAGYETLNGRNHGSDFISRGASQSNVWGKDLLERNIQKSWEGQGNQRMKDQTGKFSTVIRIGSMGLRSY